MTCCKSSAFCPLFLVVAISSAAVLLGWAAAEPPKDGSTPAADKATKTEKSGFTGDPYPLDTCIVSGEKLGSMGKPLVKEIAGREYRFCCKGCVGLFEKDAVNYQKKLDEKLIEQQLKHYPLKECVISGKPLGETAENYVYKNRLVRFCCEGCKATFHEDPAKSIAKLNDAVIAQQKAAYPLETCPVSGEKLGDGAVDHVVGVTLIRFCCGQCVSKFNEDPHAVIAKVHEGWKAKHAAEGDTDHGERKK